MPDNRNELNKRRIELLGQISCGEESLLACRDNRTRRALDQKLTVMRDELHALTTQLMTPSVESFNEFSQRHGRNRIFSNGWFLYPDGAASDLNDQSRREPPQDPAELLKARRQYVQAKLAAEIKAFKEFQAYAQEQQAMHVRYPTSSPPAPADAAEQLKSGWDRIMALRDKRADIDAQLAKTPQAIARCKAEEREREQHLARYERLTKIMSISANE